MVLLAIADEATIKQLGEVQGHARAAHRPAQDDRGAGAAAAQDRQADLLPHQRHALARDRRARRCCRSSPTGSSSRRRRSSSRFATTSSPSSRRSSKWTAARSRSTPITTARRRGKQRAAADVLGQVRRARQQPRRHGPDARAHAERDQGAARVEADDHARPARGADVSLRVDRHRSLQRAARSDHHRRVVAARQDRSDGDDQARRARRLDLRVLRRLGAELHVLHRPLAQRDRPLLRGAELRARSRTTCAPGATTTSREWFRPNPPLPEIKWGPRNNTNIQQSALLFALNHVGEEPRAVSRELLAEEQARGRARQERADLRAG